ncbi:MAG: hypothetical protein IJ412_01705 [Oscillospiraceae bacterium]|nr:hypothetical protein [Oscillospiraceae bacterium]
MAKGFAAPAGAVLPRTLLDGAKGEWTVVSASNAANYTYGHDDTGLYVKRTDEAGADIAVTMQYVDAVNFSRINRLTVEGIYGTEVPNNPPMRLTITVAAGGNTAEAVLVSCAGNVTDAVPSKVFSGALDTSALTGWGTVSIHFIVKEYYSNPTVIRVQRVTAATGVASVPGETVINYAGAYTVTPGTEAQTLATAGKRMLQDVTVEAVEINALLPAAEGVSF